MVWLYYMAIYIFENSWVFYIFDNTQVYCALHTAANFTYKSFCLTMTMAMKGYLLSKLYRVDTSVIKNMAYHKNNIDKKHNCVIILTKEAEVKTYVPQVHENIRFFKTRWAGTWCKVHSDGNLVKRKALRKNMERSWGWRKKWKKQRNVNKKDDDKIIFNFYLKVLIAQSTCITLHKVFHSLVPKFLIVLCVLVVAANWTFNKSACLVG